MSKSQIQHQPVYDARTLGKPKMLTLGLQHMFAMFGATDISNCQMLCRTHNRAKGNR